jgi:hypothetical protein
MTWAEVLLTALGSAGLSAIVIKWLNRKVDHAHADKIRAEARVIATEAAVAEHNILRQVIEDVRNSEAEKRALIRELQRRVDLLEERERHALTRAAVHEAWDQLAFNALIVGDASFPPPPPIRDRPELPGAESPDDN